MLLLVLVTMLGLRRLGVLLLISFAVVAFGVVVQAIGDYQVADSTWRTSGDPGSATPRATPGPSSATFS